MDIVQEARKYALDEIEKYKNGPPGLVLFGIAEKKALELAEKLNADKTIVQVGVCLMDLKLAEAINQNKLKEHVKMSVEASKEFLKKFNLDKETEEKIINCVEAHHGNIPYKYVEAEICANADCYKFLHPKGIIEYFITMGRRNTEISKSIEMVEMKLEEKHNILSLEICKNELEQHYQTFKKLFEEAREL